MKHVLSTSRRRLLLLVVFCLFFPGCASIEKAEQTMKIGMHIDAVLEFIVEYPLTWNKEIRIPYGSREGEVRWTEPDHPDTLLRVVSTLKKPAEITADQELEQLKEEFPGLEILVNAQVNLPAGEAWHIAGHTKHLIIDVYQLTRSDRRYLIALTSAPEDVANHKEVMERVTSSFRFMK